MSAQSTAPADTGTPLQTYLHGLRHDGMRRLDKWLPFVLQETETSVAPATYDYLCRVGRYLLLGMVQRAMHPGCKLDHCVVLAGPGGTCKSTLIEVLAGESSRYSSSPLDFSEPVGAQLDGVWLYEIAEVAGLNSAERAAFKQVLCAREDVVRQPYSSWMTRQPRQCVFVATTNETRLMLDRFADRRFWTVPVSHRINVDWVARYRDQLFAEAVAQYNEGMLWWPSAAEETALFAPMQRARAPRFEVACTLPFILSREPDAKDPAAIHAGTDFVTLGQLTRALGIDASTGAGGIDREISQWLEERGWQRVKRSIHGVRAWGYRRPTANVSDLASPAPASQSLPEPCGSTCTHPTDGSQANGRSGLSSAQPQLAPPRFVRHAQSLLRRLGVQLTWEPSRGDGEGASLVIRRARRDEPQ